MFFDGAHIESMDQLFWGGLIFRKLNFSITEHSVSHYLFKIIYLMMYVVCMCVILAYFSLDIS